MKLMTLMILNLFGLRRRFVERGGSGFLRIREDM